MKKSLKTALALVGIVALLLGGSENPVDGSCDLPWTLSCLAITAACGWILSKIERTREEGA